MQHRVIESWSSRTSVLHRRDARAKLTALLVFLIAVSTTPASSQAAFLGYSVLLMAGALATRLPFAGLLARAAWVLPFSATFAVLIWWSGELLRAWSLVEKSYLSGLAVLVLVATTPFPAWMAALESWRCPRFLLLVIQFLYRYLFVLAEQAQRMRWAALSRGGTVTSSRGGVWRVAGGTIAVLFARSWERADAIYRSMLARGFQGRFVAARSKQFRLADACFALASLLACVSIWWML